MKALPNRVSVAIVLALAVALLYLSACSANRNDESNNVGTYINDIPPPPIPPQNENGITGSPENTQTRFIPTYGVIHQPIDLGGRIIRVASTGDGITFSGSFDEPDPATSENYRIDRMRWDNGQRVRHSFNFELESILFPHDVESVLSPLRTSVMAGNPIADVAYVFPFNVLPAIMDGIFISLDSLNLPNSDVLGPQVFGQPEIEFLGERWSFKHNGPDITGVVLGVNLDIINAIGAPNPVDLYNRGQWTWEAFLDIMRFASVSDANRYGITSPPDGIIGSLIAANDGRIISDALLWDMGSPNTLEALEFSEIIFSEGLWTDAANRQTWNWAVESNSAFFWASLVVFIDELPFDFAIVPFPPGPSNTSSNVGPGIWDGGLMFPQGSEWNQAEILMVVEEFWTWHGGEEELTLDVYIDLLREFLPTDDDLHRFLHAGRNTNFCISWMITDLFFIYGNFAEYFQTREMTAQQAVDAHRASQQEIIDNFFQRD